MTARFSTLATFISTQAHAELDDINPPAAEEIDRIMLSI
ncbi:hypothetical protein ABIE20_005017 [Pseudomonas sp. 2835]